jgi:hypothetical protein
MPADNELHTAPSCLEEMLDMHLSDIYQRYAESCYDAIIHKAAFLGQTMSELVDSVSTSPNISLVDMSDETQRRETMFRVTKRYCNIDSTKDKVLALTSFDRLICSLSDSPAVLLNKGTVDYSALRDKVVEDSRERLFQLYERVCHHKDTVRK